MRSEVTISILICLSFGCALMQPQETVHINILNIVEITNLVQLFVVTSL